MNLGHGRHRPAVEARHSRSASSARTTQVSRGAPCRIARIQHFDGCVHAAAPLDDHGEGRGLSRRLAALVELVVDEDSVSRVTYESLLHAVSVLPSRRCTALSHIDACQRPAIDSVLIAGPAGVLL